MKAVVMAGGEGTRLRPLTTNRPKPLVPILGKPIAQHILEHLKRAGVDEVILTLYYLGDEIRSYFGDGSELGLKLIYSVEESPLGTAGSVKQAEEYLKDDTFIIVSGDALTDIDIEKALASHRSTGAEATIVLQRVPNPLEFGVVLTEADGKIQRFLEKPSWGEVFSDTVNTGMYILEPSVFNLMEHGKAYDWSSDIFPEILASGRKIYGHTMEEYWCDVGSLDQYRIAQYEMLDGQTKLPIEGTKTASGIHIGDGAKVSPDAILRPPVYIGQNARVLSGAIIGPDTVLGDNVVVAEGAHVEKAIVWDSSYIGAGAEVRACTICGGVVIQDDVRIEEGAVVGDKCQLGHGSHVRGNVKLWPEKVIEAGSQVVESLIWGAKAQASLFRGIGVPGIANVEITPEFATKLGASYGAYLKKGATVVTARDTHPASRMVKRALLSGLCSVGVHAIDVQALPVSVARAAVRLHNAQGGVNLRVDPSNERQLVIEFFDARGIYLTVANERKVETIFTRGDYGRAEMSEVGEIALAPNTMEQYTKLFLANVREKDIARRGFRVVVDYAFGAMAGVLPELLGRLGCDVIALNAYPDWRRTPRTRDERMAHADRLAEVVRTLGADLGVLFDTDGERIEIVDAIGNQLNRGRLLATVTSLVAQTKASARIAVPVTAPSAVESVVQARGGSVIRTKTDPRYMMTLASIPNEKIAFAGDMQGGFIFPEFHPAFDGPFALAKILEMLSWLQKPLHEVVAELPSIYMAQHEVPCPWQRKGAVMRALTVEAQESDQNVELIDGVRLIKSANEWVLALPDAAEPIFRVRAEGATLADAHDRAEEWAAKIRILSAE